MNWVEVARLSRSYTDKPVAIAHTFSSPLIICKASSVGASPSWNKAGIIYPALSIADIGMVEGAGRSVYFRARVLRFESLGIPFNLNFRFLGHIPDVSLTIWESDELPDQPDIQASLARIETKIDALANRQLTLEFYQGQ